MAASAQDVDTVVAGLDDPWQVRQKALETMRKLEPAALAQHAGPVIAWLGDSDSVVRWMAWNTLRNLEPATLAQHTGAVVARLSDSNEEVRGYALTTLGQLEQATLARYSNAVITRLEDPAEHVRQGALKTLGKLEPATLAQHATAVVTRLEDSAEGVRGRALDLLRGLPRYVTREYRVDVFDSFPRGVRSRFLGRLAWYRCRLRLREQRLALYWYVLPYRPSGPGHARDLQAWDQMSQSRHV